MNFACHLLPQLDTSLLAASVRVRPEQLKKLVAMVGARLAGDEEGGGQAICLKLPLIKFNTEYVPKPKKKKKV